MSDKYLPEFEYAKPLPELEGRQGITSDMIARSVVCGGKPDSIRSAILNKMDNGRFIRKYLQPMIDSKDIVEVESTTRRYWAYTVEAGRFFLGKYNPKGENRNKTFLYAGFLADPVEIARGVAAFAKEQADRAEKEREERLQKEQEELLKIQQEVTFTPEENEKDPIALLTARVGKLEEEVSQLKERLATPATLTKEQMEDIKPILNNTAYHIAKSIGCLLVGKDPYAPVRALVLNYVSEAVGKDCSEFKWTGLSPQEAEIMLFVLKTLQEDGITPKEEEEMRDAVQKWREKGGGSKYKFGRTANEIPL